MKATLAGLLFLLAAIVPAGAAVPAARLAVLARGINITGWFRFAAGRSPDALAAYMSDTALRGLRQAGFSFVRLPFDPAFGARRNVLIGQVRRIEHAGLAVVLVPAPVHWRLESRPEDRAALVALWSALAPALRGLPAALTFPEVLNEPVFPRAPPRWQVLQTRVFAIIRAALPHSTVILTGPDWSSIAGLQAAVPPADPDVVYDVHFYDPAELTSLAAYRRGLDRAALARLPFPMADPKHCRQVAHSADAATAALIGFVCAQHWDAARIGRQFSAVAAWRRRTGVSVVLGEFGASARLNRRARLAWIATVRRAAEHERLGWALWGYDDIMGFDLPRPPPIRPALDPELLQALGLKPAFTHRAQ